MNGENRPYSVRLGNLLTPAVKILLIANGAIFVLQLLTAPTDNPDKLDHMVFWLGLTPQLIFHYGWAWQLVSYMFLHGTFMHLAFNMFALWMFGSQLERVWGSKRFALYYFVTGIGGGLLHLALFPNSLSPVIGASGAVFGLLLAYGVLFPNNLIYIYFVLPLKAKYFVLIFGALEMLMAGARPGDNTAHLVHVGGMLTGLLYLKGPLLWRPLIRRLSRQRHEQKEARQVKFEVRRLNDLQAIRSEVDYLLGRISRVGYENLTPEEKERLEEASRLLRLHSAESEDLS